MRELDFIMPLCMSSFPILNNFKIPRSYEMEGIIIMNYYYINRNYYEEKELSLQLIAKTKGCHATYIVQFI